MLPVIALVGRPNVGKSTLFNRLTRTRDALVASFPGNGKQVETLLFSVHMDTVEPGGQVEPVLRDGVFYSTEDSIAGAVEDPFT